MWRHTWHCALAATVATLLSGGVEATAHAQSEQQRSDPSASTAMFVGTWRSGNFAYEFKADGSYVYVGMMGNNAMRTSIAEEGTYSVSGDELIVKRRTGLITNTQNYRQPLGPETTVFHWRFATSQFGPALVLHFPNNGGEQAFYKQAASR